VIPVQGAIAGTTATPTRTGRAHGVARRGEGEQCLRSRPLYGRAADLFVTGATHASFLDVNEEGIEAAAYSGFISRDADGDHKPPVVRADHPFVYLVRDIRSGCIVFLGRLVDPSDPSR
jgi:hypothetical protein